VPGSTEQLSVRSLPSPPPTGWPPRTAPPSLPPSPVVPRARVSPRKVAAAPTKGEHWQRRVRRWGAPRGRTSLPSLPTTAATTLETATRSDFFPFRLAPPLTRDFGRILASRCRQSGTSFDSRMYGAGIPAVPVHFRILILRFTLLAFPSACSVYRFTLYLYGP
jgi:hypothetical protein